MSDVAVKPRVVKDVRLTFRCEAALVEAVEREAERRGVSTSAVVRALVGANFAEEERGE